MYSILTVFILNFFMIRAQETTVVDLSEFENNTEMLKLRNISGSDEMEVILNKIGYNPEKQALRYGFQQTKPCKNFAKAYMCVRKCIDFNYDVAQSDRFCNCACFMKPKSKEKFTVPPITNGTKWMAGVPKTTIFVTPKYPPTYEDEITSEPEDDDHKDDDSLHDGDEGESNTTGGNEESGSNPEGDGLITSADGDNSTADDGGSVAEGAETVAQGGEDKPAE